MILLVNVLQDEIWSVVFITRHGLRTPLKPFPNDPVEWRCDQTNYNFRSSNFTAPGNRLKLRYDVANTFNGNCYTGQLMADGYAQHVNISILLKNMYGELYSNSSLRSTYKERVQLSLNGQLTQTGNSINTAHVGTKRLDYINIPSNCKFNIQYLTKVQQYLGYEQELEQIRQKLGVKYTWEEIGDQMIARKVAKYPYPQQLTQQEIDLAIKQANKHWNMAFVNSYSEAKKKQYLKAGVGAMFTDLEYYMENESFTIISGHDTTIAPLASILIDDNEWDAGQPGFASFIAIESFENDTMMIRFRDGFEGEGKYIKQKACGQILCTNQQFYEYIEQFSIDISERDEICQNEIA